MITSYHKAMKDRLEALNSDINVTYGSIDESLELMNDENSNVKLPFIGFNSELSFNTVRLNTEESNGTTLLLDPYVYIDTDGIKKIRVMKTRQATITYNVFIYAQSRYEVEEIIEEVLYTLVDAPALNLDVLKFKFKRADGTIESYDFGDKKFQATVSMDADVQINDLSDLTLNHETQGGLYCLSFPVNVYATLIRDHGYEIIEATDISVAP